MTLVANKVLALRSADVDESKNPLWCTYLGLGHLECLVFLLSLDEATRTATTIESVEEDNQRIQERINETERKIKAIDQRPEAQALVREEPVILVRTR